MPAIVDETPVEPSKMYRLDVRDVLRGIATAIVAAVLLAVGTVIHAVITAPGFDIANVEWMALLHQIINTSIIAAEGALAGYLGKNFLSDENGAIFGLFGGHKPVE